MQHAVEHGGGDHLVAEDVAPLRDGLIRGDEHAASLVAAAHELKEQVGGLFLERQVPELVDSVDEAILRKGIDLELRRLFADQSDGLSRQIDRQASARVRVTA